MAAYVICSVGKRS